MHASWNAILKSDQSDRLATFGVIMTTGTAMGLAAVPFLPWIEPAAWKYLVASVLIHVLYYTFLLKAYSYGDLSHTYPIARGLGPLLVALVSGRFIGEELRTQDIVGVRSEEHTSELQSRQYLVCRLLLEKKKKN